ncbi:hypothetical protein EXIGLDRAFT_749594 [Exidia glandulosa HHB12029]|uniref:Uncharacterized protein n=1 Tax=Exidia glandulosa HHB12029 TaxID=1314781 RepID=A0A165HW51_EXIGL|nr:hypothetical protein EXIGLDRAFT_749594 [Exidia glandulosa HHB12029]
MSTHAFPFYAFGTTLDPRPSSAWLPDGGHDEQFSTSASADGYSLDFDPGASDIWSDADSFGGHSTSAVDLDFNYPLATDVWDDYPQSSSSSSNLVSEPPADVSATRSLSRTMTTRPQWPTTTSFPGGHLLRRSLPIYTPCRRDSIAPPPHLIPTPPSTHPHWTRIKSLLTPPTPTPTPTPAPFSPGYTGVASLLFLASTRRTRSVLTTCGPLVAATRTKSVKSADRRECSTCPTPTTAMTLTRPCGHLGPMTRTTRTTRTPRRTPSSPACSRPSTTSSPPPTACVQQTLCASPSGTRCRCLSSARTTQETPFQSTTKQAASAPSTTALLA